MSTLAHSGLQAVHEVVAKAQARFGARLSALNPDGGLPRDVYVRYLSMQRHLVDGVQRHFFACAAHPSIARKRGLRRFLLHFGEEEEPHYALALRDLETLGEEPLAPPPGVPLWWAYFDRVVPERPFLRLGATCVLESISAKANGTIRTLLEASDYLDASNTRFLVLHQHEAVPHGAQIFAALEEAQLDADHQADLVDGAKIGALLFLGMIDWTMTGEPF